jgi:hypothetical protein
MIGRGKPEGQVKGPIDMIYLNRDNATVWRKARDAGKASGWECLGQLVSGTTPGAF